MIIACIVIGSYLGAGLLFLVVFELTTKRFRSNLKESTIEAQVKIANFSGTFNSIAGAAGQMPPGVVGRRTATIALLLTSWLFWPFVLAGYLRSKGEK